MSRCVDEPGVLPAPEQGQHFPLERLSEGDAHAVHGVAYGIVQAGVLEDEPRVANPILDVRVLVALEIFHDGPEVHGESDYVIVIGQF